MWCTPSEAIFKAFEIQLNGGGFAFVEVLSACVTNLKMTALDAQKWVADKMVKQFPLGVFKDVTSEGDADAV